MKRLKQMAVLVQRLLTSRTEIRRSSARLLVPAGSDIDLNGLFTIGVAQPLPPYPTRPSEACASVCWPVEVGDRDNVLDIVDAVKDIAAFLSFVHKRRVLPSYEFQFTVQGQNRVNAIPLQHMVDSRIFAPATRSESTWATLQSILSIRNEDQEHAASAAIHLYHSALAIADIDFSSGFLLLVSALESLASSFVSGPQRFEDWSDAEEWDKWITRWSDAGQLGIGAATELRERVFNRRTVGLRQRFIAIGMKAATDEFLSEPWEYHLPMIDGKTGHVSQTPIQRSHDLNPSRIGSKDLRKILGRIYDLRSSYAHAGFRYPAGTLMDTPMPIPTGSSHNKPVSTFAWLERLAWNAIRYCIDVADKDPDYRLPQFKCSGH